MKFVEKFTAVWMMINLLFGIPAAHMWAKFANGRSISTVAAFYLLLMAFYLPQVVLIVFRFFGEDDD